MEKLTGGQKKQIFRQKAVVQLNAIPQVVPTEIEMAEGGEGKAQITREVAEAVTVALMEHRAEPRRDHTAPVRLDINPRLSTGFKVKMPPGGWRSLNDMPVSKLGWTSKRSRL